MTIDPCSIQNTQFNNTLKQSSNLTSYSHIFECQSLATNSNPPKWYIGNFQDDCVSLFKWVNVTQQQGTCITSITYIPYLMLYINHYDDLISLNRVKFYPLVVLQVRYMPSYSVLT